MSLSVCSRARRHAPPLVAAASALFLSACCAAPIPNHAVPSGAVPSGFFNGMCHGALMLIDGLRIAFGADIALYDVTNAGWWYDAGFLLGSMLFGGFFLALFRVGIDGIFTGDMRTENTRAIVGGAINAAILGLAFLLADWSHLAPRPTALKLLAPPAMCGVGYGFWHRVTSLASLPASLVFDDTAIYQVGCSASYDFGYILPQLIFVALALLAFVIGMKSAFR